MRAVTCMKEKRDENMDLGLKGRVTIVTGASQGIGKAIAFGLSQEGSAVTICARNESVLTKTAEEIQAQTGNEVLPIRADVSKHGEIEAAVDATYRRFGRIDVLVNKYWRTTVYIFRGDFL